MEKEKNSSVIKVDDKSYIFKDRYNWCAKEYKKSSKKRKNVEEDDTTSRKVAGYSCSLAGLHKTREGASRKLEKILNNLAEKETETIEKAIEIAKPLEKYKRKKVVGVDKKELGKGYILLRDGNNNIAILVEKDGKTKEGEGKITEARITGYACNYTQLFKSFVEVNEHLGKMKTVEEINKALDKSIKELKYIKTQIEKVFKQKGV